MRIQTWRIAIQQLSTGEVLWDLCRSTYAPGGRQLPTSVASGELHDRRELAPILDVIADMIVHTRDDGSVQPRLPLE